MATEEVTTKLNIDITQFKTAIKDANRYIRMANSEFEEASAGMDKWSDSADGLKAKIQQLNKVQEAQKVAVDALQQEYDRVATEQGESSRAAQELAIQLNKAKAAFNKTGAQLQHYQKKLDETENSTEDTDEATGQMSKELDKASTAAKSTGKATGQMSAAFDKAGKAAGTLVKNLAKIAGKAVVTGIKGIAAASGALVTAFLASGEASKEYMVNMGKLDTAFTQNGHSAETAQKAYTDLVGILGETDQSVEAANHLAKLTDNEQDLAKWTGDILPGVFATFGDSLPIEGLTEAANETAKVGQVTGPLADALNWAGVSEDAFNDSLAACSTEQERQALITETLVGLYGDAAAAYKETNAEVIRSNQANDAWMKSMAGVGQAALPITSTLKLMGAAILDDLLPNIQLLGTSFNDALNGSKTAATEMGNAVGSILQQLGQKIVAAIPTILTVGGSIVTSLVQGIITAAPAISNGVTQIVQYLIQAAPQMLAAGASLVQSLVGAFASSLPQLLAAGGQMISQLLDGIVSAVPNVLQGAVSAAGAFVQGLQINLPIILAKGAELIGKLGEGIRTALPGLIGQALDVIMNFATTLYDNAPTLINTGFELLGNVVQGILNALPTLLAKAPEIISKFANIINDNFPTILMKGAELIWQIVKGIISAIPALIANIPKIIKAIVDVWSAFSWVNLGKNAIKLLKNGITAMVGAVKTAGNNILNAVTGAVKSLPAKLMELGKNAVTLLRDGITSMIGAVQTAGGNVLTAIVNAITTLPAKLLALGKKAISSLASAISSGIGTLKSKAASIVSAIVDTMSSLPGKMVNIGKNAIQGVIDGIESMVGALYDSIKNALSGLVDKAKNALGINSPSKVFREVVGMAIPEGVAVGIEKYSGLADKAVVDMAKGAVSAANSALSDSSIDFPGVNTPSGGVAGPAGRGGNTYVFNQYNSSPKALSRKEIYRDTKNALRFATA